MIFTIPTYSRAQELFYKLFSKITNKLVKKFLDAGIQDVSTSISIVHDLIEMSSGGDESDKHI